MQELLSQLRTAWDNLSSREQVLVAGAGASVLVALIVFALVMPFMSLADGAEQRVGTAEQQLLTMIRLQREYNEIQSRLGSVEQRIQNQSGAQNIRTLLETLAKESAVRIEAMEERQAGKNDHYIETKVEVKLKNVTLNQMVKYLHNIESSQSQLSVKSLRVRAKTDKSQLLDVTFSVSSFEPA
jgi:type II secretory pathway component PulM